jgi:aldehyde dehydrogenase (NAD+)
MMDVKVQNFINGAWCDPESGAYGDNINPANGRLLGSFALSDSRDIERAVAAAKTAQIAWAETTAPNRGDVVFRAWRLMLERVDELAEALTLEEGKVIGEARGEVLKAAKTLEFLAGEGRRLKGETVPSEIQGVFSYTLRQPIGIAGLITPWNFPVAIPTWKIAPAIITGNTVVLKPAEQTPITAMLVVKVFEDAGVPSGVLNMVCGMGEAAGAPLVEHPDVGCLSFTGSTDVGRMVYESGARNHKKVQCEMGGKNPIIVLPDADLDAAVSATAQGAFGSTGQRCTATSRAIVHRDIYDVFVKKVVEKAKTLKAGEGSDPQVNMGPSVDANQFDQVLRYMEIGKAEGACCEVGGERLTAGALSEGLFPAPTVFSGVTPEMRIATEEIFGPVLSVIKVDNLDEAIEIANNVDYGLSASIFTSDLRKAFHFVEKIESGMTHVNAGTIGGEAHLPFGGIKATGVGNREMGSTAIEFFTELKTVFVNYSSGGGRKSNIY